MEDTFKVLSGINPLNVLILVMDTFNVSVETIKNNSEKIKSIRTNKLFINLSQTIFILDHLQEFLQKFDTDEHINIKFEYDSSFLKKKRTE